MKTYIQIKWHILIVPVMLCTFTVCAAQAKEMKICVNINAELVDWGGSEKEDYFNEEGGHAYPARYAHFVLNYPDMEEEDAIWNDYLDDGGCTEPLEIAADTEYAVTLYTRAGDSDGRAIEIPEDGDKKCGYWCAEPYFPVRESFQTDEDLEESSGDKLEYEFGELGPRMNLTVLAGWLLHQSDLLGYPEDKTTIIKIDSAGGTMGCDPGEGWGGAFNSGGFGDICAASTNTDANNRHAMNDAAYYKFVMGHELGHRVQYAHDVNPPTSGNYAGALDAGDWVDDPTDPANENNTEWCNCDMVDPDDGSRAHCFQSREPVQDAMGEGYGHFFSAAMFNKRPDDGAFDLKDCWYAYCKQGWSWYPIGFDVTFLAVNESPPVFHYCTGIKPGAKPDHPVFIFPYMNISCDPGDEDVGIERDWFSLFWHLYADDRGAEGDHRFSIEDILAAFGTGDGDYNYQKTLISVINSWETQDLEKLLNFVELSRDEGVAHCGGTNGCEFGGY